MLKFDEAKLLYMTSDHKQRLLELKEDISKAGGDASLNQLIRDAIDVLVYAHRDQIIEHYTPQSIESLVRN